MTKDQLLTIRQMIEELSNSTQANVVKVLGLNQAPDDIETFVRDGINSGSVTSEQVRKG